MKTLKLTLGSSVAIAIANRSHIRLTSSQARQLDPLREARGRLRGSEPQGGCNACPLNEALSWGLLEGGGGKAPPIRTTRALLQYHDVWFEGKPQARSQTPVYPQERFPLRSSGKRPRHRPPIPRAPGGSPRTKTEDVRNSLLLSGMNMRFILSKGDGL